MNIVYELSKMKISFGLSISMLFAIVDGKIMLSSFQVPGYLFKYFYAFNIYIKK